MRNGTRKQFLLWLKDSFVQPATNYASRSMAYRYGAAVSQHYIGGYPKSGTTWITRMVASFMALPWIGATHFAAGLSSVIHHHWDYHPALANSIYILRDGRDVMVSTYFNVTNAYMVRKRALDDLGTFSPARIAGYSVGRFADQARRFRRLYGRDFDLMDVQRNLPRFIEAELQRPFIVEARTPWPQHVRPWINHSDSLTLVRYEDMLADTGGTLRKLMRDYLGCEPDENDIDYAVNRFSFKRLTGRERGEERRNSFARKGIDGDWINHFTTESRSIFNHYAGDLLVDLGYEEDDGWVSQGPQADSVKSVDQ